LAALRSMVVLPYPAAASTAHRLPPVPVSKRIASASVELLRRVPNETIHDLQEAGVRARAPPACSYGGYETDLTTYFEIVFTVSTADGPVGPTVSSAFRVGL
jgi:hypothetical protein